MIGIGIDSDVTRAAIKAIRDVVDRNSYLDDYDKLQYDARHRKLRIQLGVPLSTSDGQQSIGTVSHREAAVDVEFLLQQLFPNCYHQKLPPSVHIQVGGLCVQSRSDECSSRFAITGTERKVVVASLTFDVQHIHAIDQTSTQPKFESPTQTQSVEKLKNASGSALNMSTRTSKTQKRSTTTGCSMINNFLAEEKSVKKPVKHGFQTSPEFSRTVGENELFSLSTGVNMTNDTATSSIVTTSKDNLTMNQSCGQMEPPTQRVSFTSIDMLAHISASIIAEENHNGKDVSHKGNVHDDGNLDGPVIVTSQLEELKPSQKELQQTNKAPKNQMRLFVRHSYQDLSLEIPQLICDNKYSFGRLPPSTCTPAFPSKLHEALNQIEIDKYDTIFGWLPHGRSFKIHHQHEFATNVLPQYFSMTKKSSFLRQLNLYGFRRISDGSYYHERFLRGMNFLCQSMQRQKVNGNGVRAAGNPDEEPNLSDYPICPPLTRKLDLNHSSIEGQMCVEPVPSMTEPLLGGQERMRIHESVSSLEDDQAATSGSGSSDECNEDDIELDESAVEASSSTCVNTNTMVTVDSTRQNDFPLKLQRLLDQLERDGRTDIVSWLPHGHAFMVHDMDRFVIEILPQHFNQTKHTSFQRQLLMYHITRIGHGPDKGAYYHNQLQRGHPELLKHIRRIATVSDNGRI